MTENGEREERSSGISRRDLCVGVGCAAAMLALGGVRYLPSTALVRPPGGQDESLLASACVRCQKCYEICPHHVIVPSRIEDGVMQMRTPTMDFSENWCDFCAEHNEGNPLCAKTCPTGALSLPAGSTAEKTIIGKAVIKKEWCLAYKLIGCKFCYDACPYGAMELDENGRPYVIEEKCNGCGACESACVSLSNGSISDGATSRAIIVKAVE